MRKLHKLLMAALVIVPLAACDEGDDSVAPQPEPPAVGTVSGTVSVEGTGLAGVTVSLAGASAQSTTTGANGGYSFTNVVEGNYSVTLSSVPADVVFSQTTQSVAITTDGQTVSADFNGQYVRTASIMVSVTAGGNGVATQVRVQGPNYDSTLGTNANGQVQFTGLRAGTYTVSMPNPPEGFTVTSQQIQLNTGQSAQVNFTGQAEVTPAEISIQSITAGGAPINLSNVMGQIEVTLNIDRGDETLDHVDVLIGGAVVATQSFAQPVDGPATASVTLTLNVPTTQVRMGANGQWVPVVFNGGRNVSANLYVVERTPPTPSNEVPVVMQNVDRILSTGLTLTPNEPTRTAADTTGATWYAGAATFAGPQYLSYSTKKPTAVSFTTTTCLTGTSTITGDFAGGLVVSANYPCAGVEGSLAVSGPITVTVPAGPGPDGTAVVTPTAFSGLGAQFTLASEMRRFVLSPDPGLTLPAALRMDNKKPTVTVDTVAFNHAFDEFWVNGSYAFAQDLKVTDGGVGAAPSKSKAMLWVQGAPGACTGAQVVTGADLAETIASDGTPDGYQICAYGEDFLANSGTSGASNWFGVDKVAPSARIHGTTSASPAIAGGVPMVNDTANSTIYSMAGSAVSTAIPVGAANHYATAPADTWGLEALDSRSGFNQNAVTGFPANQVIRETTGAGQLTATGVSAMSTVLSDNWVRTAGELSFHGGLGVPGYYRYTGKVTDRAGNAVTITRNWLTDDVAAPTISFVTFDQTFYNVGQNAKFVIFGSDDLEVLKANLTLQYPAAGGTLSLHNSFSVGARWDGLDPFDASAFTTAITGVSVTIPNVLGRIDWACSAATTPYPACTGLHDVVNDTLNSAQYNDAIAAGAANTALLPTSVTPTMFEDAAGNQSGAGTAASFNVLQWASSTAEPWTRGNVLRWKATIASGSIVAEHMATTSIEQPFFDRVDLVLNVGGTIYTCGTYASPVLTDNGVNRFWTYSMTTPSATSFCGMLLTANPGSTYHAMGVEGSAALLTQPAT